MWSKSYTTAKSLMTIGCNATTNNRLLSSAPGLQSSSPASAASTRGSSSVPAVTDAPKNSQPSLEPADPWKVRFWVLAPTLVSHGTEAGLPVVAAPGPLLPFDVATNTPASAAKRKAMSSGPIANELLPIE